MWPIDLPDFFVPGLGVLDAVMDGGLIVMIGSQLSNRIGIALFRPSLVVHQIAVTQSA